MSGTNTLFLKRRDILSWVCSSSYILREMAVVFRGILQVHATTPKNREFNWLFDEYTSISYTSPPHTICKQTDRQTDLHIHSPTQTESSNRHDWPVFPNIGKLNNSLSGPIFLVPWMFHCSEVNCIRLQALGFIIIFPPFPPPITARRHNTLHPPT